MLLQDPEIVNSVEGGGVDGLFRFGSKMGPSSRDIASFDPCAKFRPLVFIVPCWDFSSFFCMLLPVRLVRLG